MYFGYYHYVIGALIVVRITGEKMSDQYSFELPDYTPVLNVLCF